MQESRFDEMTRLLAIGGTRRALLRGMLGGAVAALAGASAAAKPAKVGVCHYDDHAGSFVVLELPEHAARAHVRHGDAMVADLDIAGDPQHCGGCGMGCADGATCEDGVCIDGPVALQAREISASLVEGTLIVADASCPENIEGAPYATHLVEHPGGPLSLELLGSPRGGTLFDPVLLLHKGAHVTGDAICSARVAFDDDGGCLTDSYLTGDYPPGTYTAVVTGYAGHKYGTYTLLLNTFSGGVCP